MFDVTAWRDYQERFMFENEFYVQGVMNAIACQGTERIERPESYMKW